MDVNEKILQRLDELLAEAERVASTAHPYQTGHVNESHLKPWRAACMSIIDQIPGDVEHHQTEFALASANTWRPKVESARSILRRVRDDFANGWLGDLQAVAAAEVFGNLLQMAEYLHSKVSQIPAASLAGAVLEDCLRRLHLKHVGKWRGHSSIAKLNTGLYNAKFYSNTQQQQILAWAAIRNDADHGYTDKVDKGDVKRMLDGIREFIVKHEG